jgi:hypothetical protein
MTSRPGSVRNKLMFACALAAAAVLATPAAMAHDYYRGHRDDSGKVLGALVVGAVIGGVIASASHNSRTYYDSGYYSSYPGYSYGTGYGYPGYGYYGSSVNVGVVYGSGGNHWRGRDGRGYYNGGHGYYRGGGHYDGRRHYDGRSQYYRRHGH